MTNENLPSDQAAEITINEELWQKYFARAAEWARKQCRINLPHADANDFAQSALRSLLRMTSQDKVTPQTESDALWGLLYRIVSRKVAKAYRRSTTDPVKERISNENAPEPTSRREIEQEMEARIREQLEGLSEIHQQVAWLALEGYTQAQIAFKLSCSLATVKRRWSEIRTFLGEQESEA